MFTWLLGRSSHAAERRSVRQHGGTPLDLNQVTVPCDDLGASIAFYRQLGLRLIVNSPPDYARFECPVGNATFSLHRAPHVSDSGIVVYFELQDLDAKV
ncbi:MAG: VOC family protein, partial [Myxococcota bacterium]